MRITLFSTSHKQQRNDYLIMIPFSCCTGLLFSVLFLVLQHTYSYYVYYGIITIHFSAIILVQNMRCEMMADPFSWFRSRWCALIKHSQPGNRRICPDYAWAFHYHRKFIDNKIGSLRGVDVFQKVLAFVKEYEEKCQKEEKLPEGERYNSAQQELDGQVIIVIVDPFMRRVHKMVPQVRIEKC